MSSRSVKSKKAAHDREAIAEFVTGILATFYLYRHECFSGNYTTRKIHTKPNPELGWRIFHILSSEDIDDFTDIKFVS